MLCKLVTMFGSASILCLWFIVPEGILLRSVNLQVW